MKTAQSKAMVFVPAMLGRFIIGLAFMAGLALGAAGSAAAQSGPICSKFDSGKDGWGPCSWAPNVSVTTSTSGGIGKDDSYLQITDLSGASAVCSSDPKYLGNWVEKMGGCGQFCFDFKVFSSGIPPSAVTPSFSIYSGTSRATFYANFQVAIGDTNWHQKICAPIMLGDSAPPSPNGHWVISGGTWNSIITNVTMVSLPIDFSSSPSEVVGYDNICMTPGGCGEKPKEEITGCLKDSKFAVKCNPDGTYTFTLSGAGTSGSVITLVSQTPGVTVMPPQQPWAATTTWTINGATPGQLVALNANASKTGGGTAPGSDECCSGDIKVVMPECENKPPIDLKVEKENTPSGGQGNGFNVWVTNVGAPITFAPGELTVKDVVPAGLTISTQSSTNWTCGPLPAVGLATITCTYNLSGSLGTGAQLTASLVFSGVLTNKEQPLKNCAIVSIPASVGVDTNPSNDQACVTVSNPQDGGLIVTKQVINNTSFPIPTSSVYAIGASCVSGMSPAVVTAMPLTNGGSQTVSPLALGTVCTISETPPVPPSTGAVSCGEPGSTLAWTTVLPAPVTITGPGMTALVQNILNCNPPGGGGSGTLNVTKTVINKTQGTLSTAGLSYPISVSCASGGSPAVVTNFGLAENGSQTVSNIALNSSCTVTETSTPAPTGVCGTAGAMPAWSTLTIPASPVSVNGTNVSVTVQNTLECKIPGQRGYYRVSKIIDNQTSNTNAYLNGLVFPVISTCDGNTVSLNVQRGVPGIVTNIPVGAVCSVVETLPPAPTTGCPAGKTAVWGTPTYTPPTRTIVFGAGPVIQMTNILTCEDEGKKLTPVTSPLCAPPMIPGAVPGQCNCPQGTVLRGAECVKPVVCRAPLVANAAGTECACRSGLVLRGGKCVRPVVCHAPAQLNSRGTACDCPRGMIKKGNTCVERERERERPRVNPDDVLRVLPGLLGPGGFGGGGGGGGSSGGDGGGGGRGRP